MVLGAIALALARLCGKKGCSCQPLSKDVRTVSTVSQTDRSVAIVTCSMARDAELFALLARSVDDHVDSAIPHRVVVPGADLPLFRRFATPRREIIAQEDVLPVSVWKAPRALRHLAVLKPGFRRPVYLTSRFEVVRGWMLQQLLKIDMTRQSPEAAVMHVDSDVAFFRGLTPGMAFDGDRVRYFRVEGETANPMHEAWVRSSCAFLGLDAPAGHKAHYIENCVLWSRDVAGAMAARIEEAQGKPLHRAIFAAASMSEYYVYGLFADLIGDGGKLTPEGVSFCNSFWPRTEDAQPDLEDFARRLEPKHRAIAVQSTNPIPLTAREQLYARVAREMGD